jgi:hypothetical protein
VKRSLRFGVVAVALAVVLPGAAFADGIGLLDDDWTGSDVTTRKVDPAKLPVAVRRGADGVVPGLSVREATEVWGWTPFALREHSTFRLKGRDADGREVSVFVRGDGSRPAVARAVPLGRVPESDLAEARRYAAGHGYTLTRAQQVVRTVRVLGRKVEHSYFYLRGTRPDRPGAEALVWVCGEGLFGHRDLEDLHWTKLTE